jgi:predicted nucleic acid-binding protein
MKHISSNSKHLSFIKLTTSVVSLGLALTTSSFASMKDEKIETGQDAGNVGIPRVHTLSLNEIEEELDQQLLAVIKAVKKREKSASAIEKHISKHPQYKDKKYVPFFIDIMRDENIERRLKDYICDQFEHFELFIEGLKQDVIPSVATSFKDHPEYKDVINLPKFKEVIQDKNVGAYRKCSLLEAFPHIELFIEVLKQRNILPGVSPFFEEHPEYKDVVNLPKLKEVIRDDNVEEHIKRGFLNAFPHIELFIEGLKHNVISKWTIDDHFKAHPEYKDVINLPKFKEVIQDDNVNQGIKKVLIRELPHID